MAHLRGCGRFYHSNVQKGLISGVRDMQILTKVTHVGFDEGEQVRVCLEGEGVLEYQAKVRTSDDYFRGFQAWKEPREDECIKHQAESLGEQKGHGVRRKVGGLKRGACVGSLAPSLYRSIR